MRLQPKLFAGRRKQVEAGATATTAGVNPTPNSDAGLAMGAGSSLRSLGSELQQAALQSTFEYPKTWPMVAKTVSAVLLVLTFAHISVVLIPFVRSVGPLGALFSWNSLGLAIELATASVVSAFLLNAVAELRVNPQGLAVAELTGWRLIPWKQIEVLRVMELGGKLSGRYMVMIPFKGRTTPRTPAPMLKMLPSLLGANRGGDQGIMVTSDLKNFERLLQLVVSYVAQATTPSNANIVIESYVDEDVTMSTAQLLLDPETALERLSHYTISTSEADPYGVTELDTDPPVNWTRVMLHQLPIALLPAIVLFTDVLVRAVEKPFLLWHAFWAVVLLVMGMVELPFVAYLIQAVGELMVGSGKFKRAIWAYADLQIPRAIFIVLGLTLLGVGLPSGFTQALWLAGIALTTLFITRFVQKLYYMPLIHTILAAIGTFIAQLLILALYFGVR